MPQSPRRLTVILGFGILAGIVGTVGLALLWQYFAWPPPAEVAGEARQWLLDWLTSIPIALYLIAFIVLPALGVPLSLFYLTVGAVMGQLWLGLLAAWVCVAFNVALGYWLAAGIAHPLIERVVRHRHIRIPRINEKNQRKWVVLLRVSPIPFGLQSFVLALGKVRFRTYLFWSVGVQIVMSTGAILFGDSMLSGQFGRALFALFLIVATLLAISWWRRRNQRVTDELVA